ncbi:1-phosphofructokinase family hexose kinase [Paenibacillus lycopersici]|uniref:Tagatose-6-phosphate kinase n=1 Tax=Paenibacillus lycopersici TaxID=2704462 RepID=A0A6C0FWC7_9BACL|nr:1-phosphofructokinase family hexose kinase [Paenibacillus lycopersici]QHT61428.1 1-phosphofructokinase family hexose kinase [Paenibacillus lycopersici]
MDNQLFGNMQLNDMRLDAPSNQELTLPIVCASLNTAIDKRLMLPGFGLGQVNRAARIEATAGGKGLNAARVIQSLGAPVMAAGFAGGANGSWVKNRLDAIGLDHQLVLIDQETRICLNLIDESTGVSTEVLEPGPDISPSEKERFLTLWRSLCLPGRWMTLSGSLPRGLGDDYYARLVGAARQAGAHVVLDTSGTALSLGAASGPHTVKPNEDEFRSWTGDDPREHDAVRRLAAKLGEAGVRTVIVSLGRDGCVAATPDGELWRAVPPAVQAANPVGSGDAFVAGWTVACARGMEMPEALRFAVAAGTANAQSAGTGQVSLADTMALCARVEVERA